MVERVTLKTVRAYVQAKEVFKGSHLFSMWVSSDSNRFACYVVYSYGVHFPLYVWEAATDTWYGNMSKYSRSTTRHKSACDPYTVKHWVGTAHLKGIIEFGAVEFLRLKIEYEREAHAACM